MELAVASLNELHRPPVRHAPDVRAHYRPNEVAQASARECREAVHDHGVQVLFGL